MTLPALRNPPARRVFLDRHALIEPPSGPARGEDLLTLIRRLGFVQIDSIPTVERAHHMILWARRQTYRPENLRRPLERDRTLFEHWTHDASIIPAEFLPHWRLRFARDADRIRRTWPDWQGHEFKDRIDDILAHIRDNGPVSSGDVGTDEKRPKAEMWQWHPSKTALEYLWRTGVLTVCHRRGFAKVYDLTERIYPDAFTGNGPAPDDSIDWACNGALDRLGFATSGEIAAFWRKVTPDEAKAWCARALKRGDIEEIAVEGADCALRKSFARPGLVPTADGRPAPPPRMRILSPFDPALRDRNRAERLWGFFYRIEIYVPEARRQYGYYVFPLLEGDRIVGRIDLKCHRDIGRIAVRAVWPEPGIRWAAGRTDRLMAELDRLGRFTGCPEVVLADGWLRAG
jgi:uncharacterized protein